LGLIFRRDSSTQADHKAIASRTSLGDGETPRHATVIGQQPSKEMIDEWLNLDYSRGYYSDSAAIEKTKVKFEKYQNLVSRDNVVVIKSAV